jgi:antitoxin component of RelBE/YafQ-DinJ toxin-antitoxin module
VLFDKGQSIVGTVGQDLDAVVNFRVNFILKIEFEKVCKAHDSTVSREIKRYMTEVVRAQRIF